MLLEGGNRSKLMAQIAPLPSVSGCRGHVGQVELIGLPEFPARLSTEGDVPVR